MDIILFLGAVVAVAAVAAHFVARRLPGWFLVGLWGALGFLSLTMSSLEASTPGFNAIGYMVVLWFGCAPAAVGFLIGSITGLIGRKRAEKATDA